jgi:hypothetical protein
VVRTRLSGHAPESYNQYLSIDKIAAAAVCSAGQSWQWKDTVPETLALSDATRHTAGIILLTIVAIESGGLLMLRLVRGQQAATPFQKAFFRAGHAHAGVLVTLALICQILADAADVGTGPLALLARNGVPAAAVLMPAGFFLAAIGPGAQQPNRLIVLLYTGAVALGVGVVALGVGLLST